jgi:hypothetical protein
MKINKKKCTLREEYFFKVKICRLVLWDSTSFTFSRTRDAGYSYPNARPHTFQCLAESTSHDTNGRSLPNYPGWIEIAKMGYRIICHHQQRR